MQGVRNSIELNDTPYVPLTSSSRNVRHIGKILAISPSMTKVVKQWDETEMSYLVITYLAIMPRLLTPCDFKQSRLLYEK